jgi:hypothetical protein
MPKSYRIRTEVGVDKYINVNLEQDWESLEILSLKILADNVYTRLCSDYGVVTGRVFVNGGFGLPNAKVSVFVPLDTDDELNPVISELYPFKTITTTTEEGYRYNLLPKIPSYDGHASTGTFPNVGDVLMNESYIEVYDKYYRYTVTTNQSGDFMIFGVPTGEQTLVMDVDLSDIGCFSLSPQDLITQGVATESQVNGARFKSSTNLRELPQIVNLIYDVDVNPFWGNEDFCQIGITRVDFDLSKLANIKLEPTAVFMGSIISTTDDDALKINCKPKNNTGNLCELVAGPGEIQAIRQTIYSDTNGLPILERVDLEEGGKVIDGDGTYLVNLPMNLDYVYTNEFGELVLSTDPQLGIPTKGKYRFKFKWQSTQGLQNSFLRADFLVPNIKEYGWTGTTTDPFQNNQSVTAQYPTIPAGQTTGSTYVITATGGLISPVLTNVESYTIYINGSNYFGSPESIPVVNGDQLVIVATPLNNLQPQTISFTFLPQDYFDVLRSYAFSTDWDDYVNVQEAIDCEDTFYEFNYNKVYTTALFIDRYKNGLNRAKHLGIKEIDDRSCKSTVNTFPVNDIIRNFDPLFFVFNVFMNILAFPLLVLLYVAHLVAFTWPILKIIMIVVAIILFKNSIQDTAAAIEQSSQIIATSAAIISIAPLLGPLGIVISQGDIIKLVLQILYQVFLIAQAAFSLVFFGLFLTLVIYLALRVKNFPRIGLPMISYPDCNSCDCECNTLDLGDDFSYNSVLNEITQDANDYVNSNSSTNTVLSFPSTLIAPVNFSGSYTIEHPNLIKINNAQDEPFPPCESFATLLGNQDITIDVVTKAQLDFTRMASGYDIISSTDPNQYIPNEIYLLKAPQPFLFVGEKATPDKRGFGYPTSVTFPQKLNEFNTRDKYFFSSTQSGPNTGVNKIKTTVNPNIQGNQPFYDQVLVVLMTQGSTTQLGVGNLVTFQDPNYTNPLFTTPGNRLTNLTGATLNQFGTNSITGTTITGTTGVVINYANPNGPSLGSLQANFQIVVPQVSGLQVPGNPAVEQSYLQYPTDTEYFQLITGITYTDFISQSNVNNTGFFPKEYLLHDITYNVDLCNVTSKVIPDVVTTMSNYQQYEICIFVRGVDPHTPKQTIEYDLSRIFGKSFTTGPIISGSYYLNYPIQASPNIVAPIQHDTVDNTTPNLYFNSFTFTPDSTKYTAFTSNYPYYYLSTDDSLSQNYSPYPGQWLDNVSSTISQQVTSVNSYSLPINNISYYMVGGTYIRWANPVVISPMLLTTQGNPPCNNDCQEGQYFNLSSTFYTGINGLNGGNLTALYSPAYYKYNLPGVYFSSSSKIVMRSDRLPTSTTVQDGASGTQTGFALHQNDQFTFYLASGAAAQPSVSMGFDIFNGESTDSDEILSGLTETLTCEGMVPLKCYSGSGTNVGIVPQGDCVVPADRMINGCYCLLNRDSRDPIYIPFFGKRNFYLIRDAFEDDMRLFLEWRIRFTMNFAACRGVFAQTFQNNWINGVLYMFSFNKRTTFNALAEPVYRYCESVIMFNEISNTFYYRSSPWDGNNFVGQEPPNIPFSPLVSSLGGSFVFGYNTRQIQFPTTVTDLGPRDYFINQVCCDNGSSDFGSYYVDQIKTTSYQDNSDVVQLGFLSRILNQGVRQRIIPRTSGVNTTEGLGIIQFFNSTRGGSRIDGDWAQMLSINSEWKVSPFVTENVPNNTYIFFGDNRNGLTVPFNPEEIKPIMGLFYSSQTEELRYRKIMSSGIETYNFNPLFEEKFGYPKSQEVPHYKWQIKKPAISVGLNNIFGSEDNNWYTSYYGNGFFSKKYQDLDFTSNSEKYQTTNTKLGFIASYNLTGGTQPYTALSSILQGAPSTNINDAIIVGAPYHFYFGLHNGFTAVDRFFKLYVPNTEL